MISIPSLRNGLSDGATTLSGTKRQVTARAGRIKNGDAAEEGKDIEVLEPTIDEAPAMIADGRICDGKTMMLPQYAALNLF
jgi:hypothetical protein